LELIFLTKGTLRITKNILPRKVTSVDC
jgi:hypothetical protein